MRRSNVRFVESSRSAKANVTEPTGRLDGLYFGGVVSADVCSGPPFPLVGETENFGSRRRGRAGPRSCESFVIRAQNVRRIDYW